MKLTKEQRAARSKAVERAAIAALREHFTGQGATARRLQFLRGALLASVGWFAKLLFIGSPTSRCSGSRNLTTTITSTPKSLTLPACASAAVPSA